MGSLWFLGSAACSAAFMARNKVAADSGGICSDCKVKITSHVTRFGGRTQQVANATRLRLRSPGRRPR